MGRNSMLAKIMVWLLIGASIFGIFTALIYAIL